jgi:FHS family L-fucose permease-like MFS transporter
MERQTRPALILTFALFACWGLGHRLYETLVPSFAQVFALNGGQLVITQSIYSIVYLLLAVPAAIYARALGSKAGIVFGLGAWCIGAFLFYPAAQSHSFLYFLASAAVMSTGYIFVEIGANPIVAGMGPPETTVRRLNFAHALFPIGGFVAIYVGRFVILSDNALPLDQLSDAVVRPYMVIGIGVLALAFIVDKLAFPAHATERGHTRDMFAEYRTLLARPRFLAAIGAQVCCVAARTGAFALGAIYIKDAIPGATAATAADYVLAALVAFAAGRWIGALLMYRINPTRLLALFALSGVVFGGIAALYGGQIGAYAVVATSFSVSIMYATILGTAIKDLGPMTTAGTALIYIGAAGGGLGLTAMHLVWTMSSIELAMLVPTLGFVGVLVFALTQKETAAA